jgi:indole-3-glycerol phosphate synthase
MSTMLEKIVAHTRRRVNRAKSEVPNSHLEAAAREHTPRGFRQTLSSVAASRGFAVIAELKKASPSKGLIRQDFPVATLASQFAIGGAAALSVLTEEHWFQGSLTYLREASAASGLPCLRKDFIVDEYQLLEARANRADAVLLIVAALDAAELPMLYNAARALELDVLVEAHDEQEIARAIAIGAYMIGVNSRNLKTLEVDPANHQRLATLLPPHVLRVAESGIRSGADVRRLQALGYQAFLIGETLMREEDPGMALQALISEMQHAGVAAPATNTPQ